MRQWIPHRCSEGKYGQAYHACHVVQVVHVAEVAHVAVVVLAYIRWLTHYCLFDLVYGSMSGVGLKYGQQLVRLRLEPELDLYEKKPATPLSPLGPPPNVMASSPMRIVTAVRGAPPGTTVPILQPPWRSS